MALFVQDDDISNWCYENVACLFMKKKSDSWSLIDRNWTGRSPSQQMCFQITWRITPRGLWVERYLAASRLAACGFHYLPHRLCRLSGLRSSSHSLPYLSVIFWLTKLLALCFHGHKRYPLKSHLYSKRNGCLETWRQTLLSQTVLYLSPVL